jgi:hypothetical protein
MFQFIFLNILKKKFIESEIIITGFSYSFCNHFDYFMSQGKFI